MMLIILVRESLDSSILLKQVKYSNSSFDVEQCLGSPTHPTAFASAMLV
jgi:hypothetical protein